MVLKRPLPIKTAAPAKAVKAAPTPTATPVEKKPLQTSAKTEATATPEVVKQQPPKEVVKETTLTVKKTVVQAGKDDVTTESTDSINVRCFATQPATVSYGASIKKSDGNYGSVGVLINLTVPCYVEELASVFDDVRAKVHGLLDNEAEILGVNDSEASHVTAAEDPVTVPEETTDGGDGNDAELTADDVALMSKAALVKLIKTNELDIDTTLGVQALRQAVIAVLEEDDGATESAPVADAADAEDGEELSEEDIQAMSKEELEDLIDEHALPIKKSQDRDALCAAVIAYMNGGEDALDAPEDDVVTEKPAPAELDNDNDVELADEGDYLTEDELKSWPINDLKDLAKTNGIGVKVKLSSKESDVKAAYIKAIMDYQNSHEDA